MIIYKGTNKLNGKVYIGQTTQTLQKRNSTRMYDRTKFSSLYREVGAENFEWEVLEEVQTQKELDEREIYWISYYDSTNPENGYNVDKGGSIYFQDGEHNYMYGKPAVNRLRVKCLTTGKEYDSLTECSIDTYGDDTHTSKVTACCKGRRKQHNGHTFRYIKEDEIVLLPDDLLPKNEIKDQKTEVYNLVSKEKVTILELSGRINVPVKNVLNRVKLLNKRISEGQKIFRDLDNVWFFKEDYDKFKDCDIDSLRETNSFSMNGKRIKNLFDGKIFNGTGDVERYYKSKGYRISKHGVWSQLKKGTKLRFTPEFKFVYVD